MSLFNIADFECQNNSKTDIYLNNGEEIRDEIIKISKNTLKNIKIYTPETLNKLYITISHSERI